MYHNLSNACYKLLFYIGITDMPFGTQVLKNLNNNFVAKNGDEKGRGKKGGGNPPPERGEGSSASITGRGFLVFDVDDGTPQELTSDEEDRYGGGARDHPPAPPRGPRKPTGSKKRRRVPISNHHPPPFPIIPVIGRRGERREETGAQLPSSTIGRESARPEFIFSKPELNFCWLYRCLELLAPKLAHQIYHGNRTWLLCIVPTVYAIILPLYTPPILFSGLYMSWFFNPYVGYVDDFGKIYHSPMHTIHDMFVIFGLSAIYITFSVLLIIQTQSYNAHYQASLAQKLVEFTI
ncbi:hypothetical protein niasHS_005998 [Heterodera schachtii]|uniref:Uncharacterized protein n=1 Tax=Heterodera schachtii TaxID=97005 RepID=A0ABD2K160_HETSC